MDRLTERVRRRCKKMRKALGWSQGELARRAGVHRSFVALLEGPNARGLSVESLGQFAKAFGVPPANLLSDEEPAPGNVAGPGPPEAERGLLEAFRLLGDAKQWRLVQDLQRRVQGLKVASTISGTVTLGEIAHVARGAEPPAGCVKSLEMPAAAMLVDSADPTFGKMLLKEFTSAARNAGSTWAAEVEGEKVEVRPSYCFEDLRAITPYLATSVMLYSKNMPRVFKDNVLLVPAAKVVIEPRSLLACADEDHTLVPQTMVVAVPYDQPDADQVTIACRIAATLSLVPPERLAPGVDWFKKSYRPKVSEIRSLRLPATITGESWEWRQVDRLAGQARSSHPLVDREPLACRTKNGLDHCVEQRDIARRAYPELAAAIEYAFKRPATAEQTGNSRAG